MNNPEVRNDLEHVATRVVNQQHTGRKLRQYHNNKIIQHVFTMKEVRSRRGEGGREDGHF